MSFELLDIYDEIRNPRKLEYLIAGCIEMHTTGALIGESRAGKSFVAIDLACSVITGISWIGGMVVKTGPIVYLAGEGHHGINRRVLSWEEFHHVCLLRNQFFISSTNIQLDQAGAKQLIEKVDSIVAKCGERPVLIIVDTLSRAMPLGKDENATKDMMAFLNIIDVVRDRYNCVVLIVHHTGHGSNTKNRARGSSSFRAALDFEFLLNGSKKRFEVTKMKESELPDPLGYEIISVGDSAVVVFGDEVSKYEKPTLTKSEREALDIFKNTCAELSKTELYVDEWKDAYKAKFPGKKPNTVSQAFGRTRDALLRKNMLELKDGVCLLYDCDRDDFP